MLVSASPELVTFVRSSGGTVWVRCRRRPRCGGVVFLDATVRPPASDVDYEPFMVEDVLVAVRLPFRSRPD